jgi:predicted molibdopterin-dependent oxidoreductase YjgC
MVVRTNSERVRHSRKMVLEFLGSSADLSTAPDAQRYSKEYGANPDRYADAQTLRERAVKVDNRLYVRDYAKCILCYKCVEACGAEAQNTFAITAAGRGFEATISTEFDVELPDSACVYCGNCVGVCPTGALMFTTEYEMRRDGMWNELEQMQTDTICSYCGVGCTLTLHVQDNEIVKVTSPVENDVTCGHLCVKGRFGYTYVQNRPEE